MSQDKQDKTGTASSMSLPGFLSALVVLAILGGLGFMLFNRAADSQAEVVASEPVAPAEEIVTEEAQMTFDAPPPMLIDPDKDYTATITTPRGNIQVELLPEIAPQAVNNFVFLAREGFYNGLTWHRVIADFMAQGGDPTGTGSGGPGYTIPDEFTSEIMFDRPGLVAMARPNAPDSAGSQFFITTAAAPWLNQQYTVFGEVVEGQEIVNNIPLRDPARATQPGEEIVSITITEE